MDSKRMFLLAFLLMTIMSGVTSLLVPQGLSPTIIEDLESNYHSLKSLSQKAAQLRDLLPEEDFLSISTFLNDFKNYIGDYKSQESRSGFLLQKIYIKLHHMESGIDRSDDPLLNEKLLKDQAEDLRKLVQELETKIDGIKADPMMFTKEKADDLYKLIQLLKEKYSPIPDSIEEFYATQEAKEAKMRQADQLGRQKLILEGQIEGVKYDKQSKDFSLGLVEGEIRDLNEKIENVQRQFGELEKPQTRPLEPENVSNKVFHCIFLVDTSFREESQNILEQVDANIEALKSARESERDVFSLIAFDKKAQVLAERLPIIMNARFSLRDINSENRQNLFEKGLEKAGQFLKKSRNVEEIPIVILYTDGMRWSREPKPVLEEDLYLGEGYGAFFWKLWSRIVNWVCSPFVKGWFLKPMKESEIQRVKDRLADFSERYSYRNLIGFVSGTTSENQEILRNFAKALNRNEIILQTTIGEKYEYFNLATATRVFPQIVKTLSIAERGPLSREEVQEQARKRVQKETEEMEIFARDAQKDFDKNRLLKERDDLEKKLNELLRKKDRIESEIKTFLAEIEKLQSEINSIESSITSLTEEIRVENQKNFEREQAVKERGKIEAKYAAIRTHLETLEQLTKTVQARDHNILAIFEHVATYCKDFLMSLERDLPNSEASDYDSLIEHYKDRLELDGTDVENMEKICEFWLGGSYDKVMARKFLKVISPHDLLDENLKDIKEEYQEFYLNLRKKVFAWKREQKMKVMSSQKSEIKSLFSQDMKKLMEKLNERIYMMY